MILNFGENLKRLRKERNLSQEQLSEMLNVSRQAISKWESNKTYPDIENLILLRNIFNIALDDLLFDENKDKIEDVIKSSKLPTNSTNYDEDELEDELSDNFMIGGFIIGISIGFITDNFMWGIAGSFIGMGVGYLLRYINKRDTTN
ncbi:XRE family transcriptional regulator [Clostridioides difficile]|nr:helix-turn-helix transcriptional regulator [Clostridioides sp. ZZV14-6387]MCI9978093.1 helix-turn-helix transcriptional regulator [Clostridioides difficile]MDB3084318.1 XRE family transcriptional regulator [Clostridioides difficile]